MGSTKYYKLQITVLVFKSDFFFWKEKKSGLKTYLKVIFESVFKSGLKTKFIHKLHYLIFDFFF